MDLRLAGMVERYHTWPTLTRQSDAEHSWQVARILLSIAPGDHRLLVHALLHDCGEIVVGDLPFPVKSRNPALREAIDGMESYHVRNMLALWAPELSPYMESDLDDRQKTLLKIADLLDMLEFGCHEVSLGSRYGDRIVVNCHEALDKLQTLPCLTELDQKRLSRYRATRSEFVDGTGK